MNYSIFESWFGITWSSPFSENIGFGITMYVPYRSQRVLTNGSNVEYNNSDGYNKSLIMTTVLYFSAEWFNKVNTFAILEPKPFITQSSGELNKYNLDYSLNSVFNFGFGVKQTINKNFTYYGGITTDRTAYNPNAPNPFVLSTWDIVHIRSGGEFKFHNLSITLGLSYGYSGDLLRNFDFFGLFRNDETDVIYHQIDVIFGFSYSL